MSKNATLKNTITPAQIIADYSDAELLAVAQEVLQWNKSGQAELIKLGELVQSLKDDVGMFDNGLLQVAEALVLKEVCNRWVSLAEAQTSTERTGDHPAYGSR